MKTFVCALFCVTIFGISVAQQSFDERCEIREGNGFRVDDCDGSKNLVCKDGRCQCADPVNQIYDYREEVINSRSRRTPGKGKGGVSKGLKNVGAGVVGGVAGYAVAKGVSNLAKGAQGSTQPPRRFVKKYACYSRVSGQCALSYSNYQMVDSSSTTSSSTTTVPTIESSNVTTEAAPVTTPEAANNVTTTSSTTLAPVAAAQTAPLDITKLPQCVRNAECKSGSQHSSSNGTSSFLKKVDYDPRIGACQCRDGYQKTTKDLCVRVSGAEQTGISAAVILASLVISKLMAL